MKEKRGAYLLLGRLPILPEGRSVQRHTFYIYSASERPTKQLSRTTHDLKSRKYFLKVGEGGIPGSPLYLASFIVVI